MQVLCDIKDGRLFSSSRINRVGGFLVVVFFVGLVFFNYFIFGEKIGMLL